MGVNPVNPVNPANPISQTHYHPEKSQKLVVIQPSRRQGGGCKFELGKLWLQ